MRRGGLWLQAANLLTATRLVAAGALLFLQPLTRPFLPLEISAVTVCAVAGFGCPAGRIPYPGKAPMSETSPGAKGTGGGCVIFCGTLAAG